MAEHSKYLDRIIVSSDSEEILKCGSESKRLLRPPFLATDSATSEAVIAHALYNLPSIPDFFVLLQPTSPYRTAQDIDTCIEYAARYTCCISTNPHGHRNGAVYACSSSALLETLSFPTPRHYHMPLARSLDLDTEADFLPQ